MYNVEFTFRALKNIDDIKSYISIDNPIIWNKVITSILNTVQYLYMFPKLWIEKGIYREIIEPVYRYQIRYKVDKDIIYIITIYKYKNEL